MSNICKKNLFYFLIIGLLFISSCQSGPTGPGKKVIMSGEIGIKGIPKEVIPYGEGLDIVLKNPIFNKGDLEIKFSNKNKTPFSLVCYFSMKNKVIVFYLDQDTRFIVTSKGKVGFNLEGLKLTDSKSGNIKLNILSSIYGIYDFKKDKGKLYVFCVKGEINVRSLLPGEQKNTKTFMAFSNVLEIDFSM